MDDLVAKQHATDALVRAILEEPDLFASLQEKVYRIEYRKARNPLAFAHRAAMVAIDQAKRESENLSYARQAEIFDRATQAAMDAAYRVGGMSANNPYRIAIDTLGQALRESPDLSQLDQDDIYNHALHVSEEAEDAENQGAAR
jgi:hypothetical protein